MHDSHGFFTQYPIASADLPPARQPTIETKVTAKSFWENGKPVRPSHELQKEGTPRIELGRRGYVLYGVEEESEATTSQIAVEADDKEQRPNSDDANRPPQGIAMLKDDLAEIELLIHKGNTSDDHSQSRIDTRRNHHWIRDGTPNSIQMVK